MYILKNRNVIVTVAFLNGLCLAFPKLLTGTNSLKCFRRHEIYVRQVL